MKSWWGRVSSVPKKGSGVVWESFRKKKKNHHGWSEKPTPDTPYQLFKWNSPKCIKLNNNSKLFPGFQIIFIYYNTSRASTGLISTKFGKMVDIGAIRILKWINISPSRLDITVNPVTVIQPHWLEPLKRGKALVSLYNPKHPSSLAWRTVVWKTIEITQLYLETETRWDVYRGNR